MRLRLAPAAFCLAFCSSLALAQTQSDEKSRATLHKAPAVPCCDDKKGQLQPQGWTGPLETTTGGAPAESPQGQSPPGMQAAPEGSSKSIVDPKK